MMTEFKKTSMSTVKRVNPDELEKSFELPADFFPPKTTWEGQKEAKAELRKLFAIKSERFNIAVVGPDGVGKGRTILEVIEEFRELDSEPQDLIALDNFEKHDEPYVFHVPKGYGKKLNDALQKFVNELDVLIALIPEKNRVAGEKIYKATREKQKAFEEEYEKRTHEAELFMIPRNAQPGAIDLKKYFISSETNLRDAASASQELEEARKSGNPLATNEAMKKIKFCIKNFTEIKDTGQKPPEGVHAYLVKRTDGDFYIFFEQLNHAVQNGWVDRNEADTIYEALRPINEWVDNEQKQMKETHEQALTELGKNSVENAIKEALKPVQTLIDTLPNIASAMFMQYCQSVKDTVLKHAHLFQVSETDNAAQQGMPGGMNAQMMSQQMIAAKEALKARMTVNILIDSTHTTQKPFIEVDEPSWENLVGYIERKFVQAQGTWTSDFRDINPGILIKAHGGYIKIKIGDLFNPAMQGEGLVVWGELMKVLKTGTIELKNFDPYKMNPFKLKIPQIPVRVKVILDMGISDYRFLSERNTEFINTFKVAVEFNTRVPKSEHSFYQLAAFVDKVCGEEKLNKLDRSGLKEIAKYASRIVEDRNKFSLNFGRIADIIREAHARSDKAITAENIQAVLEDHESSYIKESMLEARKENLVLIRTTGERIGEINALAVFMLGKSSFGMPYRVTVNTEAGNGLFDIVDIEGKGNMSGDLYKKAFSIDTSKLMNTFPKTLMAFNAGVAFEQSYSGIDGDSASITVYCAIISSLSDIPIKQQYAITGSMSQKGEVGVIGGVNQKIEGFYRMCKEKRLTGDQGVIIPAENVQHLVLSTEVLQAIREKKFNVFPVKTVEEALEIMTGVKAGTKLTKKEGTLKGNKTVEYWEPGTIYAAVQERLNEFNNS